jgi:hypothetical protein
MRILVSMVMAFMLVAGCSDDDNGDTGTTDGSTADTGTMTDSGTVMDTGPTTDGGTTADGGITTDGVVADSVTVEDGSQTDALSISAVCTTIITHCSGAALADWFVPFTEGNCITIFQCVIDLFTDDCTTKYNDFLACISTVASADDCDNKCKTLEDDMQASCECPASCGVNCGP